MPHVKGINPTHLRSLRLGSEDESQLSHRWSELLSHQHVTRWKPNASDFWLADCRRFTALRLWFLTEPLQSPALNASRCVPSVHPSFVDRRLFMNHSGGLLNCSWWEENTYQKTERNVSPCCLSFVLLALCISCGRSHVAPKTTISCSSISADLKT